MDGLLSLLGVCYVIWAVIVLASDRTEVRWVGVVCVYVHAVHTAHVLTAHGACEYVHVFVCTHTCTFVHIHVYAYMYMYAMHACVYARVYACIYVCVYIRTYVCCKSVWYTHTHRLKHM